MNQADINFLSDGYTEMYKEVGHEMTYVPLGTSLPNAFGETTETFQDDKKITVYGVFNKSFVVDPDLTGGSSKVTGVATLVLKQLRDAGLTVKLRDALDITLNGVSERFTIVAIDNSVRLVESHLLAKVQVEKRDE